MEKRNIAQNIKSQRVLKGFSQDKLADLAKLSLRTVQRIENNETEASGHSLIQLAIALETTPEQLQVSANRQNESVANQNDKIYLSFLSLSALSFFIFPLLGILIPAVLWMIKIGQIKNIARIAKRLIVVELICSTALYVVLLAKIMHWPIAGNLFIIVGIIYVFNLVYIIISALQNWHSLNLFRFRKVTEQPIVAIANPSSSK